MRIKNQARVWQAVTDTVVELLEELGLDAGPIEPTTMLHADLGISSIDAIHMMVLLEDRLDKPLNFQELATRDGEYVEDLSVGELFEFVCSSIGVRRRSGDLIPSDTG